MHLATADRMKEVPFPGSIQCLSFASSFQLTHKSTKLSCRRWCLNRVLLEELAKRNVSGRRGGASKGREMGNCMPCEKKWKATACCEA